MILTIALLVMLLGSGVVPSSAAVPSPMTDAYTYDSHLRTAALTCTTPERGPATACNRAIPLYAVDRWLHGATARSKEATTAAAYDYSDTAKVAQVARGNRVASSHDGDAWANSVYVEPLRVAAKTADEVAEGVSRSPSFIVKPNGETVIVPKGAQGPFLVESGKGFMFRGGSGGHGLSDAATDVRIMDPVTGGKYPKPNGYASYLNGGGQTINPFTGQTVGKSSPWWHWEFLP